MAQADVKRITGFYAEAASLHVAEKARQAIEGAVRDIAEGVATHRPGKRGTREYVLDKFPYIIIYRPRVAPSSRLLQLSPPHRPRPPRKHVAP